MAVAKTLEIISSSTESIEAAVRDGITKAAETVHGIQEAWCRHKAIVRDNNVAEWRVTSGSPSSSHSRSSCNDGTGNFAHRQSTRRHYEYQSDVAADRCR